MAFAHSGAYAQAALAVRRQTDTYRAQGNWVALLCVWLRLARQFPREEAPLAHLINDFQYAAVQTRSALPPLVPSQDAGADAGTDEGAAALDALQRHLLERLEGMTRRRGIRICERRGLRAGRHLTGVGPWWPWAGPPCGGVYVLTLRPSRPTASARRRQRPPDAQLLWPGHTFMMTQPLTSWRPFMIARFLGTHAVMMRQRRYRLGALDGLSQRVLGPPPRTWGPGLRQILQLSWDMPGLLQAASSPEGQAAAERIRDRLLFHTLRQELRLMPEL